MKTKSLLLGSAAALFAVTGAQAADVIIPEPEMVEYVRVCDAAGTGYFYIPGTETCLKIGGYARYQINSSHEEGYSEIDSAAKLSLQVSSWTDSEIGPITTFYEMVSESYAGYAGWVSTDSVYLSFAGLKMGFFGGFLDNGINGETDGNSLNSKFTSIQYSGTAGAAKFGASVDYINPWDGMYNSDDGMKIGVTGMVGFTAGAVDLSVVGFWDVGYGGDGGVVVRASTDIGMGTLQARGTWASGWSMYNTSSSWDAGPWDPEGAAMRWVAEVSYAAKVSDKLTVTPGFSWTNYYGDDSLWKAGVTVDYKIAANLAAKLSVQYTDRNDDWNPANDRNSWSNFLRFQASF
jgi:hypothetical protein